MVITSEEIRKVIGKKIKTARSAHQFTQEHVAENIGISIDLLRNIENGRNLGSVTTLLKICNILELTPNDLFFEFVETGSDSYDIDLRNLFHKMSKSNKNTLKEIIVHLDKNYSKF